jgi:hypothetical protein
MAHAQHVFYKTVLVAAMGVARTRLSHIYIPSNPIPYEGFIVENWGSR